MPENKLPTEGKGGRRINKGMLAAVPCLIVSCIFLYCARTYPNLVASYMLVSASFFPTLVSTIMVVMSVIMLIQAIVKPEYREPLTEVEKKGLLRGILAIGVCILYVLCFKPLGYIVSSILALFLMLLVFGNRKWVPMAIVSVVLPLLLFVLFKYALQTNLPNGILQPIADLF